jgi:hypothetical protein
VAESPLELGVGAAQGALHVHAGQAGEIGDDEQEIAELFLDPRCAGVGLDGLAQLVPFLLELGPQRLQRFPLEADRRGLSLQGLRPPPGRESRADAAERARILGDAVQGPLGGLDRRPGPGLFVRVRIAHAGKDVRVPAQELGREPVDDLGEIEPTRLAGELRMEHDLQQEIAQLLAQPGPVLPLDRIDHLVSLLHRIGRQARKVLTHIPRTAAFGIAQARHDGEQVVETVGHGRSSAGRRFNPAVGAG